MQRLTSGRREECQGYCWYAPFRGPSTFHWQLNWLRSARGAMVPWGFATTVILRPAVLLPEVDLACLQPGRELDRDGGYGVTRCLKQDPTRLYKDTTSSLPDPTSSLKRRTRKCSFRGKTILACWSAQGRWSSATKIGGSAAWCVQSTRHGKNHHCCSAVPPARESSENRAQLVEFTRSAEVRSRTM